MKLTSGIAAVAVAASVSVVPLVAASPTYAAPTAGDRSVAAGTAWLTSQLTGGLIAAPYSEGLSADIAFALSAVGGNVATVTQIVDALEPKAESWVGGFTPGRVYAGSLAKMVSVVEVANQDPTSYNGTDQLARLEDMISSDPDIEGRLEDAGVDLSDPYDDDFVNVIGQSFAARALTSADSARAGDATTFLLDQQCDDGSFRAALTADKSAPDQGCPTGDTGEVDTTALTVINILETPDASVATRGAAYLAASWLKTQQAADGSFAAGFLGTNSNSTGLAGWALREAGQDAAAARAATWLRGLQVADLVPCATTLAAENGAIAYSAADLAAARAAGAIGDAVRDKFRRATAQALPALASLSGGADVAISAPATALEKSTVTVDVTGLGAGEPACVSVGGQATPVTGTGSVVPVSFALPSGAATHTFTVTTLTGTATAATIATAVAPPAAEPTVGEVVVAKVVKVARKNSFRLAVDCDAAVACTGKVKVRTVGKLARADGRKRRLVIAKAAYSVAAGDRDRVTLKLTKPARAVLGTQRVRVVATQTAAGADTVRTTFWIRRK